MKFSIWWLMRSTGKVWNPFSVLVIIEAARGYYVRRTCGEISPTVNLGYMSLSCTDTCVAWLLGREGYMIANSIALKNCGLTVDAWLLGPVASIENKKRKAECQSCGIRLWLWLWCRSAAPLKISMMKKMTGNYYNSLKRICMIYDELDNWKKL